MRLPKFIEFNDAIWEFRGSHLRDKIPHILRTLRRFPMDADKAVVAHCYIPYWGVRTPVGTVRWEVWKTSRKR